MLSRAWAWPWSECPTLRATMVALGRGGAVDSSIRRSAMSAVESSRRITKGASETMAPKSRAEDGVGSTSAIGPNTSVGLWMKVAAEQRSRADLAAAMMMVDTVSASTSFIAHHPFDHHRPKGIHARRTLHVVSCRHLGTAFAGRRLVARVVPMRQPARRLADWPGRALAAVGFTKEAVPRKEFRGIPGEGDTGGLGTDDAPPAATPSWPPQNRADDPSLHNPLMRLERMGCGWVGVIFEWEGMVVEDDTRLERQAWLTLAEEEGKSPPPAFILRRVEGMKAEHAVPEGQAQARDDIVVETRSLPRTVVVVAARASGKATAHAYADVGAGALWVEVLEECLSAEHKCMCGA
ncbi:genetic modifier [Hordeum vulgare]|nr:genetic modifier [Hordeum vulgare]